MRFLAFLLVVVALVVGGIYMTSPTVYNFGNGGKIVIPCGVYNADQRDQGFGVCVEAGANVTAYNESNEWRTLTVSYRQPGSSILWNHAFEDLPPKSSRTFGANSAKYIGMYVSISTYAQKKRDQEK